MADDKSVYAYVPDMIRYYLSEEPILANVDTRLCRRPEDLEYTLDNLQDLVVKRVGESGGYGMLIGPHSTAEERDEYAKQVRANPPDFISQPVLDLSRSPCLIDGRFEPRHVDLRPFVLHGRKTRIVPGAFCRVSPCVGAASWSTPARAAAARIFGYWRSDRGDDSGHALLTNDLSNNDGPNRSSNWRYVVSYI